MKEIYILDSNYIPTAAATNRLLSFALAFQKLGVKVTFFYLFPYQNRVRCQRYTNVIDFVYLWDDCKSNNKYYNTVRSLIKLRKILKPEIPLYSYSNINCLYFIQKKGIRVFHEQTEHPEVVGKVGGIVGTLFYTLYKKAIKKVDGLFVITHALKDLYIKELGADPAKTTVINMTVDQSRFINLPCTEPSNTISYCGYISEYKDGVSVLIRAFAKVSFSYPNYSLQIIGPFANNETEANLRKMVKDLGIDNNVRFTGPVSADSMPVRLKTSKILALARPNNTQAKYGFATKIGEYLMTERPAVLTRVGAVDDYLTDKKSCILANPDDPDDFADKLLWTIEHYEEAREIGRRGKEVVLNYFDSEKEAEKIYKVIFG